ncbi:hypothetical protein TNCV_3393711 [Trichonephila clavipes]|nr:hypothetical protein TNCV_3393711 [Trichonephila clavipes]
MAKRRDLSWNSFSRLSYRSNGRTLSHDKFNVVQPLFTVMSPSIVPSGNFAELIRTATCMVLSSKANDRHTSSPFHDEFRGPRYDYVRQVALATTTTE